MARYAGADAIDGLPYVNGHVIEVAEGVHADGVGQLFDGVSSEVEVGGQGSSSRN